MYYLGQNAVGIFKIMEHFVINVIQFCFLKYVRGLKFQSFEIFED